MKEEFSSQRKRRDSYDDSQKPKSHPDITAWKDFSYHHKAIDKEK